MTERELLAAYSGGTCWDYARAVWRLLTGDDLGQRPGDDERPSKFRAVPGPVEPCVVLMTAPSGKLHVGVFWQDRVWHLRPRGVPQGARLDRLAEHGRREYFACE